MFTTGYELFRMKDDESIQDMYTRFTSIVNGLHSIGEESKVNATTEAKDLQKLTIDELIGNLKTYEMKKMKDHEIREPKREKNLVLKVDNNDSSGEDGDMAYLTRRFQKMVRRNRDILKRAAQADQKAMTCVINTGNQDISLKIVLFTSKTSTTLDAWYDSSSEYEGNDEQRDTSMMEVEIESAEYDSIFALMAKSDEGKDDDGDEGAVKGSIQSWYMDYDYSKHMTRSTDYFLSLKSLQGGSVSFGNSKKGYILGVRRVRKTLTHSIENVYYVNGLKYSLLSVSQICDKGNKVEFLSKTCTITNLVTGEVVLMAKRFKNIYISNFESLTSGDLTYLSVVDDDAELWHRRLGHASFSLLNKRVKKDLIQVKMSYNVVSIRSDHDTEFDNAKFNEFFAENGISHNFSAPITPPKNGVVERKNRSS
ncbi:uncharacterized protein LOC142165908 [Nicotiana tabacum]|uniref:Uncharacterized protein LOC142165908 n=1 Tax=Nicotiana tabacum TaxID=4097 RepID=A0AC58S5Y6_TOBAC